MLGCAAPDLLVERRDRSPCHYSILFSYARFLPPRSGLMNLAVGLWSLTNKRDHSTRTFAHRADLFLRRGATVEPRPAFLTPVERENHYPVAERRLRLLWVIATFNRLYPAAFNRRSATGGFLSTA